MLPIAGLGVLNAGVQLANTGIQAWQNRQANKFNREMADYNYSKELDMYNKANEYNTPANQMKRFEEAGLNPNLIYGQGSPGLAQASMPKYQDVKGTFGLPGLNPSSLATTINAYQDFRIKSQQVDLLKAQIDSTNQETENKRLTNGLLNLKLNLTDPYLFRKLKEEGTSGWENIFG